jgi:hypothetical protein
MRTTYALGYAISALIFFGILPSRSNADLYLTKDLVFEPVAVQEAIRSNIYRLETTQKKSGFSPYRPGSCSGVFISNEGHFLTAAHCLYSAVTSTEILPLNHVLDFEELATSNYPILADTDKKFITLGIFNPLQEIRFMANFFQAPTSQNKSLLDANPKLIFIGRTFGLKGYPEMTDKLNSQELAILEHGFMDAAIIRVNIGKNTGPVHCVPVQTSPPQTGHILWAAGYPGETEFNGMAYPLKWSSGPVMQARLSDMIDSMENKYSTAQIAERWRRWEAVNQSERVHLANLQSIPGMSGGPLLNAAGQIEGIVSAGMEDTPLTNFVTISSIYEQVAGALGPNSAQEIFHCQNH